MQQQQGAAENGTAGTQKEEDLPPLAPLEDPWLPPDTPWMLDNELACSELLKEWILTSNDAVEDVSAFKICHDDRHNDDAVACPKTVPPTITLSSPPPSEPNAGQLE